MLETFIDVLKSMIIKDNTFCGILWITDCIFEQYTCYVIRKQDWFEIKSGNKNDTNTSDVK